MKIKIIVIDPELSTRGKRILAAIVVPAILLGGAAVAWATTLHTWMTGDTLKAADLNANFTAVETDIAAVAPTAWTPYTCNVQDLTTGTVVGGDTSTCVWRKNGNSADVRIYSFFASAPSPSHVMSWPFPPGVVFDPAGAPGPGDRNVLGAAQYGPPGPVDSGLLVANASGGPRAYAYYSAGGAPVTTSDTPAITNGFVSLSFSLPVMP